MRSSRAYRRSVLPIALGMAFSSAHALPPLFSLMPRAMKTRGARGARSSSHAPVVFEIVDAATGKPIGGYVLIRSGNRSWETSAGSGVTSPIDLAGMTLASPSDDAKTVRVPMGGTVSIQPQGTQQQKPVKTFTITVTASRRKPQNASPIASAGTELNKQAVTTFKGNVTSVQQIAKGQAGVTTDSAGQIHVRGEHTDISYVVDGVPLPDTLSGRAGSIVVPSTIENLDMITGGFAPEFGAQTAAVMNITTLPTVNKDERELTIGGGSYNTLNGQFTAVGRLGPKFNYVLNLTASQTDINEEPNQPADQSAHNHGTAESAFVKLRYASNARDTITLSASDSPDQFQIPNRTGLPSSYAGVGEGYGFTGLRNSNGVLPEANGAFGSQTIVLASQQADGQDINESEANEFAVLNYVHRMTLKDTLQAAFTVLHSGQDLTNKNPAVNALDLPIDNSIEYNPTVSRNVHQLEGMTSLDMKRGEHDFKFGLLYDSAGGVESYNLQSASRLALDALAALDPILAPLGTSSGALDVNGYPVYTPTSGLTPTVVVTRTSTYEAAYAQDTWKLGRLTSNYGFRFDQFFANQNLGQPGVNVGQFSPRFNFSYQLDNLTEMRWSYDHLLNVPPVAQGALVGESIQPEILDQYDIGITHKIKPNQTISYAYYVKSIKDQTDVGLLVPGSQIGLYSAVYFQRGEVHGNELSYEVTPMHGEGIDGFANFTYSAAKPNGNDNTGAPAPDYNDHDQREAFGSGLAYVWRTGASVAMTYDAGSGLSSSTIGASTLRHPNQEYGLHLTTGDRLWHGHGGISLDVYNVFDNVAIINFQSAFSGTRFQEGRRILLSSNYKF